MNGRQKRRKRAERARNMPKVHSAKGYRLCMNGCGKPGPHYVPPSLGQPGFYICAPE